jgi:hypothetical protein
METQASIAVGPYLGQQLAKLGLVLSEDRPRTTSTRPCKKIILSEIEFVILPVLFPWETPCERPCAPPLSPRYDGKR